MPTPTTTGVKVVAGTIASIAIAWIGAWQTTRATASPRGVSAQEVRDIVDARRIVTPDEKKTLIGTLQRIDLKVTAIQVQEAKDGIKIQLLLQGQAKLQRDTSVLRGR